MRLDESEFVRLHAATPHRIRTSNDQTASYDTITRKK